MPGGTNSNENQNAETAEDTDFRRFNPCPYFHIRGEEWGMGEPMIEGKMRGQAGVGI